jgi:peptidoglycan/LPS O-acetylase OafA/YrhL
MQLNPSRPKHRLDIDGLRAVAVLAVVMFHAFPKSIKGGFVGVDIFFVISGYLISTILFESLDRGTFSFSEFYSRRIKRIFPALILVLIASLSFGWFALLADELNQLGKHAASGAGFISNIILWNEAGYFDNSADTKPLLHLWSLGIEEQFYIIWPLLLWFAWRRKLSLFKITLILAVLSFILNISGVRQDSVATFYSPITRFWELLCGSLIAWFSLYRKAEIIQITEKLEELFSNFFYKSKPSHEGQILSNCLSVAGFLFLFYGFFKITKESNFPGSLALLPVLGAALIIFAGDKAWINRVILSNKVLVWFGLISYPLYLWHWPLLSYARILNGGHTLSPNLCIKIILASILLAWLTVKLIENPFRFGTPKFTSKITVLTLMVLLIGITGLIISRVDFSQSRANQDLAIKRRGAEYALGSSNKWFQGEDDWLFLGNAYDNIVAKMMLSIVPSQNEIEYTKKTLARISKIGAETGTKIVLIIGPNKSTIYPEYLPDELTPSSKRYISFFLESLKDVPNLAVYDPTSDLLKLKKTEGILYGMTDTHWNNKGAYLAYVGFLKLTGEPIPKVEFRINSTHKGDLIAISGLKDFPLHAEDNWEPVWKSNPILIEKEIPGERRNPVIGPPVVVNNHEALSNKCIWVIGDSFSNALRQYFNATFKEVHYVGHWDDKIAQLDFLLACAEKKPDMVVIIRTERAF